MVTRLLRSQQRFAMPEPLLLLLTHVIYMELVHLALLLLPLPNKLLSHDGFRSHTAASRRCRRMHPGHRGHRTASFI